MNELNAVKEIVDWLNKELEKMPEAFNELFTNYVSIPIETETLIVCGMVDNETANFGVLGLLNGLVNAKITPNYRLCATFCPVSGIAYFDVYDVQKERSTGYGRPKE